MDHNVRQKLLTLLSISNVIFLMVAVGSCNGSHRQKIAKDKELYARLDLEEKLNKMMQGQKALEEKIKEKDKALEEETKARGETSKLLAQERLMVQSLKDELEKLMNSTATQSSKLMPPVRGN